MARLPRRTALEAFRAKSAKLITSRPLTWNWILRNSTQLVKSKPGSSLWPSPSCSPSYTLLLLPSGFLHWFDIYPVIKSNSKRRNLTRNSRKPQKQRQDHIAIWRKYSEYDFPSNSRKCLRKFGRRFRLAENCTSTVRVFLRQLKSMWVSVSEDRLNHTKKI